MVYASMVRVLTVLKEEKTFLYCGWLVPGSAMDDDASAQTATHGV